MVQLRYAKNDKIIILNFISIHFVSLFLKAFVDKFSRDLSAEVKHSGVTVQTVHPGFVVTNMSKLRRSTLTAPTPDKFAAAALFNLGLADRTAGFWFHKIQVKTPISYDKNRLADKYSI